MTTVKRPRWVYWPPLAHLALCLIALLGRVIPGWIYLGDLFIPLIFLDLPFSGFAVGFMFANHGVLAVAWVVLAGTLWWFILSLEAESIVRRIRSRFPAR
jgi:hypothetical protein